jgi:hypothetical protein
MPAPLRALLIPFVLLWAACGGDEPKADPLPVLQPGEHVYGEEIWVPYEHPSHAKNGIRDVEPTRAKARERIETFYKWVVEGQEDLPDLARRGSRMPAALVGGYTGPLPRVRSEPDARDQALMRAQVGALTPIIEWNQGFCFARRVPKGRGRQLHARYHAARNKIRARGRAIAIHYRYARPHRYEFDKFTKEMAIKRAEKLIAEIKAGRDFASLAEEFNNDAGLRQSKGVLRDLERGAPGVEWINWTSRWFPYPLLVALLETGEVGSVMPKPLVTRYGVFVLEVLERHTDS